MDSPHEENPEEGKRRPPPGWIPPRDLQQKDSQWDRFGSAILFAFFLGVFALAMFLDSTFTWADLLINPLTLFIYGGASLGLGAYLGSRVSTLLARYVSNKYIVGTIVVPLAVGCLVFWFWFTLWLMGTITKSMDFR